MNTGWVCPQCGSQHTTSACPQIWNVMIRNGATHDGTMTQEQRIVSLEWRVAQLEAQLGKHAGH
jgi:hypothetical protein